MNSSTYGVLCVGLDLTPRDRVCTKVLVSSTSVKLCEDWRDMYLMNLRAAVQPFNENSSTQHNPQHV